MLAQSLAAQGSRQGVLNLHGCSVNVLMEGGWGRAAEKRDKARGGEREEEGATHGCELATWAQGLGRLGKTCLGGQRTSSGCASGWATCPRSDVRDALQVGARWAAAQANQAAARWAGQPGGGALGCWGEMGRALGLGARLGSTTGPRSAEWAAKSSRPGRRGGQGRALGRAAGGRRVGLGAGRPGGLGRLSLSQLFFLFLFFYLFIFKFRYSF